MSFTRARHICAPLDTVATVAKNCAEKDELLAPPRGVPQVTTSTPRTHIIPLLWLTCSCGCSENHQTWYRVEGVQIVCETLCFYECPHFGPQCRPVSVGGMEDTTCMEILNEVSWFVEWIVSFFEKRKWVVAACRPFLYDDGDMILDLHISWKGEENCTRPNWVSSLFIAANTNTPLPVLWLAVASLALGGCRKTKPFPFSFEQWGRLCAVERMLSCIGIGIQLVWETWCFCKWPHLRHWGAKKKLEGMTAPLVVITMLCFVCLKRIALMGGGCAYCAVFGVGFLVRFELFLFLTFLEKYQDRYHIFWKRRDFGGFFWQNGLALCFASQKWLYLARMWYSRDFLAAEFRPAWLLTIFDHFQKVSSLISYFLLHLEEKGRLYTAIEETQFSALLCLARNTKKIISDNRWESQTSNVVSA
jgi:hypothetical protein